MDVHTTPKSSAPKPAGPPVHKSKRTFADSGASDAEFRECGEDSESEYVTKSSLQELLEDAKADITSGTSSVVNSAVTSLIAKYDKQIQIQFREHDRLLAELDARANAKDSEVSALKKVVADLVKRVGISESAPIIPPEVLDDDDRFQKFFKSKTVIFSDDACVFVEPLWMCWASFLEPLEFVITQ